MTRRQEAALETRKRLIEAAGRMIRAKGLVNTSVAEIAREAEVSTGTFYTYFKRKEDVLFELSRDMFREILETAQERDLPFTERLSAYMADFSGYIEQSSLKMCQEWIRNTADPDLIEDPRQRAKLALDISSVKALLDRALENGEIRPGTDTEALASAVTDILYGEMLCWCMAGGVYSFRERTEKFCRDYLPGLLSPYLA